MAAVDMIVNLNLRLTVDHSSRERAAAATERSRTALIQSFGSAWQVERKLAVFEPVNDQLLIPEGSHHTPSLNVLWDLQLSLRKCKYQGCEVHCRGKKLF